MASTVTPDNAPHPGKSSPGAYLLRFGTINLGVYAANGVAVTPAQFGLSQIVHLDLGTAGGFVLEFDKANSKVKAYRQTAATSALIEVPNATDITASVGRFMAIGK